MGGLALLPVGFLAFEVVPLSQRGIQAAVLELHTKLAEKLAEQIDGYFKVNDDKLSFALATLRKNMQWSDKQELLRSLIETHSDVVEFSVLNGEGMEILKVYNPDLTAQGALTSRAQEEGFQRFLSTRQRAFTIDSEVMRLYYPINKMVMARVVVSLKGLSSRIASERVGGTGFAVLVDAQGRPLFFPEGRVNEGFKDWDVVKTALQSAAIGSTEFRDPSGLEHVGAYAPVHGFGGAVVILQARDEAYYSARMMRRTVAWVLLAVVAFAVLAATLMARRLSAPILGLTRAAEAVARGDFSRQVTLDTGDEMQKLGETFNQMTSRLRHYADLQVDKIVAEQKKTEAILSSISDGVVLVDMQGVVQRANALACEFLQLESLEGRPLSESLPPGALREAVLEACKDPRPDRYKDVNLSNEEERRHLQVNARPVVSQSASGVVLAIRDVTLERELEKMKEEFLHYITHDLRNPLGSAMGFIDVLLKGSVGVLNPDQHRVVSSVKRSCMRLMGLINNILDIAKMESGQMRLQLKETSLAGIAGRSISILESLAVQKEIKLELVVLEEYSIQADADLLERVFTNLIGNAIKYTPTGGRITVSLQDDAAGVKCCVSDTGEGIPPEYKERIFQKFEQVQGQRRGGTGLGLTITKFFVEQHLGKIWVESEPGKGSQFYFTVPKGLAHDAAGLVEIRQEVA